MRRRRRRSFARVEKAEDFCLHQKCALKIDFVKGRVLFASGVWLPSPLPVGSDIIRSIQRNGGVGVVAGIEGVR
jgi:hypothetical protein